MTKKTRISRRKYEVTIPDVGNNWLGIHDILALPECAVDIKTLRARLRDVDQLDKTDEQKAALRYQKIIKPKRWTTEGCVKVVYVRPEPTEVTRMINTYMRIPSCL